MRETDGPTAKGWRAPALRVGYLVNRYPQTSHTFIRREIAGVEAAGLEVARFSIRPGEGLVDGADVIEAGRTRVLLSVGSSGLLSAVAGALFRSPRAFLGAASRAYRVGAGSRRGVAVHLVYLAEACVLKKWLEETGCEHLHAHFGTNPATVALLCRELGGPPYSVTVHGPEEFDAPRELALGEKVKQAAFVVAISEFTRSQLYRWASPEHWPKVRVVRCGVDPSYRVEPAPAPGRGFVCVGRLAEQKGQLVLVRAVALLRDEGVDCEVVLVGDGPMRAEVEGLISALGVGDRVRLAGWCDGDGVRRALVNARALVLPSFAEGLPVVLMEALALGRPAISTYVAGTPELVLPGESGWLVPAGSVEALAGAMRSALETSPEALARMGRAGSERVQRRHDSGSEASRLAAFFEEAHARERARPEPESLAASRRPPASARLARGVGTLFRAAARRSRLGCDGGP